MLRFSDEEIKVLPPKMTEGEECLIDSMKQVYVYTRALAEDLDNLSSQEQFTIAMSISQSREIISRAKNGERIFK